MYVGQFVIGFVSLVVMQVVDNFFWVDFICGDIQVQCVFRYWVDIVNIIVSGRQLVVDVIGFWQCDYVYFFGLERGW